MTEKKTKKPDLINDEENRLVVTDEAVESEK
jgi:hypothetical protein